MATWKKQIWEVQLHEKCSVTHDLIWQYTLTPPTCWPEISRKTDVVHYLLVHELCLHRVSYSCWLKACFSLWRLAHIKTTISLRSSRSWPPTARASCRILSFANISKICCGTFALKSCASWSRLTPEYAFRLFRRCVSLSGDRLLSNHCAALQVILDKKGVARSHHKFVFD